MKTLVYSALKAVEIQQRPEPTPGPQEVKVRISATGICGSDVHGFLGHSARRKPGLVLGHETVGHVVEGNPQLVGNRVSVNPLICCGTCPACRAGRHNCCANWRLLGMDSTPGAFAEFVVVPERNVHPLPESVSDAAAVMVEPLANAFHILSMIPPSAGLLPSAVILGGGTLGACILTVAKARGLNVIAVSEPNALRAEVARKLGASNIVDPSSSDVVQAILDLTDGFGVPVAIDAVGNTHTRNAAAKVVSKGGTALLLGLDEGPTSFDFYDLVRREVRLQTSFAYTEFDYAAALDFVIRGGTHFDPWTEVMPLEQGQEAFEKLISNRGDIIKVALRP